MWYFEITFLWVPFLSSFVSLINLESILDTTAFSSSSFLNSDPPHLLWCHRTVATWCTPPARHWVGAEYPHLTASRSRAAGEGPWGVQSRPKIPWSAGGGAEPKQALSPCSHVGLTMLLQDLPTQSRVLSFQLYVNVLIIFKFQTFLRETSET